MRGSRTHHPKVVVINITGAPDVDATVANHLVRPVDTSRLRGTSVIITELPHDRPNAGALGVDLGTIRTSVNDQGGLRRPSDCSGYSMT